METTIILVAAVVLLLLLLRFSFIHGGNTISSNQTLSGDQTIVSSRGIYELGFFKPGNSSSKNYIGIWYHNIHPQTVVWVANRDKPISDTHSSQLKILGRKLILVQSQTLIWSTDEDNHNSSSPIEAILGDNGNFVLKDESLIIWQSFDHPVDTWLPGSKLSYNKLTNSHQIITSWKNYEDPSVGLFSIELDASNSEYISRWNQSVPYWNSGSWDGEIFSNVPEMRIGMFYNWSYINNENESYFTYSTFNTNLLTRFFLDLTGQVKQTTWIDGVGWNLFWTQPGKQCDVHASCGPNGVCNQIQMPFCNCIPGFTPKSPHDWDLGDFSGGCGIKTQLNCHHNKEGFKLLPGFRLPYNSISWPVENEKDCEVSCLNNCSCSAYAYSRECLIWSEGLLNLEQLSLSDGNGKSIYIKLAAASGDGGEFPGGKRSRRIIMGAAFVAAAVSVLSLVLFFIWRRRKNRWIGVSKMEGYLIAFAYKDIQNATKNFSERLGGGAFGSVYKGMLPDSTLIAVKRLDSISQGEKQFRMEVSTIGTVQHVNLIRLRGFCSENDNRLLVYDYMQNGSLGSVLFHENNSKILDWKTRQGVAIGTARGLAYLHDNCRDCIVHCDIKPENILLDSEFCPIVADFGLAKLIGRDFSRVLTTMRGTRGYLAPEWLSGLAITAKADVYSYGMMVFELISGRRNSERLEDGRIKFFPTLAANLVLKGGDIVSLLDDRLDKGGVEAEEVMRIYKVACWCIQNDENDRPTMGEVVQILEGVKDVKQPPIPRLLQVFVDRCDDDQDDDLFFFKDPAAAPSSSSTDKSRQPAAMSISSSLDSLGGN